MIPVIDLFAGPGGLSEGFSRVRDSQGNPRFRVALSVEKDPIAHRTLRLRSFCRQFGNILPDEYYQFVRGEITEHDLYAAHPVQATVARDETLRATLGKYPNGKLDAKIRVAIGENIKQWVLIGGPPCQAYSLVGRSRQRKNKDFPTDHKHFLYRAYLRIIAAHRPPVFVMENVKGMLSSQVRERRIIDRILRDLRDPYRALPRYRKSHPLLEYDLYPLSPCESGSITDPHPEDFLIRCEEHGIPQARHRVIIVGVRRDISKPLQALRQHKQVPMWAAISDLPRLRSRLSSSDSKDTWLSAIRGLTSKAVGKANSEVVAKTIRETLKKMKAPRRSGAEFLERNADKRPTWQASWLHDPFLGGVLHHSGRRHMRSDLQRYFYAACYAKATRRSPKIEDFPKWLRPKHKNVTDPPDGEVIFKDRFRVQVKYRPATTITAHAGKDGHYVIHPDPTQCRSLTVREVARLQTFPDNYFFIGGRTNQYQQVGNAVPPLLARGIGKIISKLFD